MKSTLLCILLTTSFISNGQDHELNSTIDFVQILNDNNEEALYYYQNNWKVLREMALKKGYIDSFQLLEVTPSPEAPFDLILITTYADKNQYDQREDSFSELIKEKGELKLMNNKKLADFRKTIFGKAMVKHWN